MSLPTVGFIGIGTMGWPMAQNIHKAGYPLTVYDLNAVQTEKFAAETGATAAASPADLAECELVVTMLPNGDSVRQVLVEAGDGAWLNKVKHGTVVIDMSSSAPTGTRSLSALLAEKGVALVDAPVSGARPRAITGTLTIMVGGDDAAAIEKARPLLNTMGNRLFACGTSGCGHAAKALNNYVAATAFAATSEACLIAERFGLDQSTLVEILNVSTGKSFISEVVMQEHVVEGKFATGFALGLLTKDVRIAAGLGDSVGLDAPVLQLMKSRWESANAELGESADHTEAIKSWDGDG